MFNSTFSPEKPIIFPYNWDQSKTGQQILHEWQTSLPYLILSNLFQTLGAALLFFIIGLLVIACKQLWKLSKLDEGCKTKLENRKYIEAPFLLSVGFVGSCAVFAALSLAIIEDWTRGILLRGLLFWVVIFFCTTLYKNVISKCIQRIRRTQSRKVYQQLREKSQC